VSINPLEQPVNRLIESLPRRDMQRLVAGCEQVELLRSEILAEPGDRIRHVYFPTGGFVSMVMPIKAGESLEVGLAGDEGMVGSSLVLGVNVSALRALVQGAGPALRIDSNTFRRELEQSMALQRVIKRYIHVLLAQLAQTAACTRYHVVEARLARWLLMTRDRAHSDHFHVTHEFLACMLGVRRVGVTKAATALQKRRLISYHRGHVEVLDRRALEAASCLCYAADKESYEKTMAR
jgi:CRP-like cAMP-binding protein